jgi:hypothetical protein
MVDSIEHRRQHADIRLRPRDDEAADFLFCEEGLQGARKEGAGLSMTAAGGMKRASGETKSSAPAGRRGRVAQSQRVK